jgi:TPR repeat protein
LAIKNGNIEALNNLANLYAILHRFDDAEKYYLLAINKGHLQALYNLAILYKEENRQDDAEKYYLLAIDNGDDRALNNLAALYQEKDQFDLAEQYYKAAIDKGINQSLVNLLKLYYSRNMNKQKVVNLVKEKIAHKVGHESMIIFSIVFLWAGQMKEFEETAKVLIPDILQKEGTDDLMDLFFAFLVHKQYNYVWSWFNNREFGDKLREMVKPLYYLTAEFIKGQEEEALRPGPEIEESIKEIREELVKQQAFYYE